MSGFRHEALLYRGTAGFAHAVTPVVVDALGRGESVLVAVPRGNAEALRDTLPGGALDDDRVMFLDMAVAGRNPARSVSIWHQFARQARPAERRLGIAELFWSGRTTEEIIECQHAEAVLNLALAGSPMSLTCAYDTEALEPTDVRDAAQHHLGIASMLGDVGFPESALADPPMSPSVDYRFGGCDLQHIRDYVGSEATSCLIDQLQTNDMVLAVNEVATNSIRHGGGQGRLRTWRTPDALICEISDAGFLDQPLAGMCRPVATGDGGAGMWLIHQICDLVQVRSSAHAGTIVRLTMHRDHQPEVPQMGVQLGSAMSPGES
jgi:anti-sigma regulatory factor (Ser/Thr protein kinase)